MAQQTLYIEPSSLSGMLKIPPSKSHSMRALLFALLGKKTSKIHSILDCDDTRRMEKAIQQMGARCKREGNSWEIEGGLQLASSPIEAGLSGLVLRLLGAVAALLPGETRIRGDFRRPLSPLIEGLRQLGGEAHIRETLVIRGPLRPGRAVIEGIDSQPVSGLLIAVSFLPNSSEIFVTEPGEQPWIDLTLDWIDRLGGRIDQVDYQQYRVGGGLVYDGFDYTVPGDFSSAAFGLGAAFSTGSSLTLTGLDFQDVQGDKRLFDWMQKCGGEMKIGSDSIFIEGKHPLEGGTFDLNLCIDALPLLAVLGCFAKAPFLLENISGARLKESDRVAAITQELKKMGAIIEETATTLRIFPAKLRGAELESHQDHRIAMALAIAALGATTPSKLRGIEAVAKTYPTFVEDFQKIGACFTLAL